jgi:hypothetical protein
MHFNPKRYRDLYRDEYTIGLHDYLYCNLCYRVVDCAGNVLSIRLGLQEA